MRVLLLIVVCGCSSAQKAADVPDTPKRTVATVTPAPPAPRPDASPPGRLPTALSQPTTTQPDASPPTQAGPCVVNVPECDEYLAKITNCSAQLPPGAQATMERSLLTMCNAWRTVAQSPANHSALAQACKTAMAAMKQSWPNCNW